MKATYYDEACRKVDGFEKMAVSFMKQLVINGRSKSTHLIVLSRTAFPWCTAGCTAIVLP
ncbi:MAG: hypothetical protein KKA07_16120 [Bacteroidetes bacterium]|nr:hypothetical protein [Bacteroidota bacterium]MBU1720591.1 hypothetical protein [Bacteroidota bacterium]